MKKIVFKYTVKVRGEKDVQTHFVRAYTKELGKEALAAFLEFPADKIRCSRKNPPYLVRKLIFEGKDPKYKLTLDVNKKPLTESTIKERQAKFFDLRSSILKATKYRINALYRHDKILLLEYSDFDNKLLKKYPEYTKEELADNFSYGKDAFKNAYDSIRETIIKEKFENETFNDGTNILTVLDDVPFVWYSE